MVYALASYLFFSGLIHKVKALIAVSFTVVFLYGDMFWGVFPILPELSWESHLFGAIVGCLSAFFFANQMPAIETSVELKKKTNDHYSLPDISDPNIHKIDYRYKESTKKKMP
jgi:membrane associated rhomboid family serine protease